MLAKVRRNIEALPDEVEVFRQAFNAPSNITPTSKHLNGLFLLYSFVYLT
jgi:hypothetical protein